MLAGYVLSKDGRNFLKRVRNMSLVELEAEKNLLASSAVDLPAAAVVGDVRLFI